MAFFAPFIEFLYKFFIPKNLSKPSPFSFTRFFLSRFTFTVYQALTVNPPFFPFTLLSRDEICHPERLHNTNLSIHTYILKKASIQTPKQANQKLNPCHGLYKPCLSLYDFSHGLYDL